MRRSVLVLSMLWSGCLTVVVTGDSSAEADAAPPTPALEGAVVDELFVPAHRARPTTGRAVLAKGQAYELTIDGTISAWAASQWRTVCAGQPEAAPRYPAGSASGRVGVDPSYVFAVPGRSRSCRRAVPARRSAWYFRTSRFGDWQPEATDAPYDPSHTYTRRFVGEGAPLEAYVYDSVDDYHDNYGGFRIDVREVGR